MDFENIELKVGSCPKMLFMNSFFLFCSLLSKHLLVILGGLY